MPVQYLESINRRKVRKPDGAGRIDEDDEGIGFKAKDWEHLQKRWRIVKASPVLAGKDKVQSLDRTMNLLGQSAATLG